MDHPLPLILSLEDNKSVYQTQSPHVMLSFTYFRSHLLLITQQLAG